MPLANVELLTIRPALISVNAYRFWPFNCCTRQYTADAKEGNRSIPSKLSPKIGEQKFPSLGSNCSRGALANVALTCVSLRDMDTDRRRHHWA